MSAKASVYGKCVSSIFGAVQKDSCAKEYQAFRDCISKTVCSTDMSIRDLRSALLISSIAQETMKIWPSCI